MKKGLLILLMLPAVVFGKTTVNVALTSIQPPFVISEQDRIGLVYDVLDLMNEHQDEYLFNPQLYPTRRIIDKFDEYDIDVIAYNDIHWGWLERGGLEGRALSKGRDLFYTLKVPINPSLKNTIVAVSGFHYAFADFDAEKLTQLEYVSLVTSEEAGLRMVLRQRVEKGIASEAFLNWISVAKPDVYSQLIIDRENPDHLYQRQFITFADSVISLIELNQLISNLCKNGSIEKVYKEYGLTFPNCD